MSLPTTYQKYIHLSRYARFREDLQRRETWEETVARYCDYWRDKYPEFPHEEIYSAIVNLEVMPSMRALMTAGPSLDRDNVAGYNCSFLPIDSVRAFDECMYILLCGTGVGFSVERQYINELPEVPDRLYPSDTTVVVADSKIGWATALREFITLLYLGKIPKWDVSKVRPAGARLRTFGGRASGPGPLVSLFQFLAATFLSAQGRRLNSLEVHDTVCKIAESVVSGGVRRSALISLSNLTDERLQRAKSGSWWETHRHRALANNSAAYTEKPDVGVFLREWGGLYDSKSGERGIFNRVGAKNQCKSTGRRDPNYEFGTNPCGEIILRPNGFCNLSEVVVRCDDTPSSLLRKVRLAAIVGTFQATLTDFRYLRRVWRKNAEDERLLGVSLTGIMDHELLSGANPNDWQYLVNTLQDLKKHAINTNADWASRLGISHSAAITTVKPSGTVSQLVDSSSGIHPRHSLYYIRRVRTDAKDPLGDFIKAAGVPCEPDVTNPEHTHVFSFPQKAPASAIFRNDRSALEQLQHYLLYKENWCEHNPSITVYVKEHEWMQVGAWVYDHFESIGGIAFLPFDGGLYQQAPYEEVTEAVFEAASERMPVSIPWEDFHEITDQTSGMQELACSAGICEIN